MCLTSIIRGNGAIFQKKYLIVSLATLLMAAVSTFALLQQKRGDAQVEIESVYSELELALATLSVRMASIATGLERSEVLSPAVFRELYADQVRSSPRVHERAMAFIPEMASLDSVETAVDQLRQGYFEAGYPDFSLFPEEPTEALFPVLLAEPEESRPNVFGYNMGSSAERLAAAREALERGVMTTSAPVSLSQDTDQSRASFLLLYPVYFAEPQPITGARRALIAAGMTPSALFLNHAGIYDRHRVAVEIGIAGVSLPVNLASETVGALHFPLVSDIEMPPIQTNGFEVPFRASVSYSLGVLDAAIPIGTAALAAWISLLLVNLSETSATTKRELEDSLQAKEAELREVYGMQARSQRVEALGRLVAGVAHDFNNILSVILGNLELMKEEDKDKKREDDPLLEEAVAAVFRGAHLTRQLLLVGRKSHLHPQALNIASVLQDSAAMLVRVLPESTELTTVPAAGLWPVKADPDGLQNALLNLAINARDAMNGKGKLVIEAVNSRVTDEYLDDRPDEDFQPGRYVTISVTDTGTGMSREVADQAFEPFFTTKHATDGSGLGLSSVLGFCRQSGGACRIYSEPGVGTTVRMLFPVSESSTEPTSTVTDPKSATPGKARILLAEDEDSVARVLLRQLEASGYAVKRVATGDAAWALIEDGAVFDLLITDLVMPGTLQGAELARRVEAGRPGMALLLISGYPQEAAIEGNGVARRHPVLTKPVPRSQLIEKIHRLLDE